jgi:hypothetical protein
LAEITAATISLLQAKASPTSLQACQQKEEKRETAELTGGPGGGEIKTNKVLKEEKKKYLKYLLI